MLSARIPCIAKHLQGAIQNVSTSSIAAVFFSAASSAAEHVELPRRRRAWERKPRVTSVNELKRQERLERISRQEVREVTLRPPDNGLLVKRLVPVAHEVSDARKKLYACASRVIESIPVHTCRVCREVHVGRIPHQICDCNVTGSLPTRLHQWMKGGVDHILPVVESFHLYDRLGRAVSHEERLQVERIPAVIELCIQAGVDISEYPTKRRVTPVYSVAGKIIDFERKFPRDYSIGKDIAPFGFWEMKGQKDNAKQFFSSNDTIQDIAEQGMEAWEKVRSGVSKLMLKYMAQTCGFCSEVQVGPKGHRARICQAYKHQMRNGQHAWQEATIEDLVPPVYVWHVPDPDDSNPLVNKLRGYYGKLPSAVELFAQAGAVLGDGYGGLMREDVTLPELDEENLVV